MQTDTTHRRHIALVSCLIVLSARHRASAFPSYGSRVPNGERVPCPTDGSDSDGCVNGYCRGLGHGSCAGGYAPLPGKLPNPFGQDFKNAGFQWTPELCATDSDGDGYTNGQELGDPCCVWTADGSIGAAGVSPYTLEHVPSHPGDPEHRPPDGYIVPACGTIETTPPGHWATSDDGGLGEGMSPPQTADGTAAFNPGETRGSFDLRMRPYTIPRKTTTYVDFLFNLPDDLPDVVHIVFGEAIVDQPKHLHHFVVQGCPERFDEKLVGIPLERPRGECNVPVGGFSGWAPGAKLWDIPTDSGVPIGEKFGIKALQINVHYTDGDAPYLEGEAAITTDGIRIHYTPDLRRKTVTTSSLISVGAGPKEMVVEPNKERAFMTRTCTVRSRCHDASDRAMGLVGSRMMDNPDLTCQNGASTLLCANDLFQVACPVSCGLCQDESPRNPDEYSAVSVFYHAHILGREMYTTLIPKDDPTKRIDLRSRNIWSYDDQTPYSLETGTVVRPGDKIQTTCVFDSTGRDEPTQFDLSTYDEMCINTIGVMFDTPPILDDAVVTAANDIHLRGFACESSSEEDDIWMGELGPEDDGRKIIDDHPLSEAECSFATMQFATFDSVPTGEMRCRGEIVAEEGHEICGQMQQQASRAEEAASPVLILDPRAIAGHRCTSGSFAERDSNDGTTEELCLGGGGTWEAYTCSEAERWLLSDPADVTSQHRQYLREYWWAPRCCMGGGGGGTGGDNANGSNLPDEGNAGGDDADGIPADLSSTSSGTNRMRSIGLSFLAGILVCSTASHMLA